MRVRRGVHIAAWNVAVSRMSVRLRDGGRTHRSHAGLRRPLIIVYWRSDILMRIRRSIHIAVWNIAVARLPAGRAGRRRARVVILVVLNR